ncbi:AAA family ATPase [Flavobacterium sp. CSZ]|uniref:AAA family ATPase n=1 Tax=Flavobacterium sp. CSZ TaxID=2783791 RepID=UPI00188D511B|nr:AAA family ATPase [Flavobacterium sp. CSZ]MBF4486689.1 AAA family ATPase [Flavobacterium sp. CSZ]
MIRKIGFSNYKAFDNDSIELKPITILLGANSSGKSSLLQLILLFKQTLNIEGSYESALKLNGKYIGLGEIENIFKNRNTDKDLTFSFGLDSAKSSFQLNEITRLKRNIETEIIDLYFDFLKIEQLSLKSKKEFERVRKFRFDDNISINVITEIIKEIKRIQRKYKNFDLKVSDSYDVNIHHQLLRDNIQFKDTNFKKFLEIDINEYLDTYKFISEINNHKSGEFDIEFDISYSKKNNNLLVNRISVIQERLTLIEYHIQKKQGNIKHILRSDIFENRSLDKYRVRFGKNVKFDTLNLIPKSDELVETSRFRRTVIENEIFCNSILKIFYVFNYRLNHSFNSTRINYISPLRAFPKRYYFLDESNVSNSLDSIDGDNLTETLKKESNVISKVNKWLNNFGLSVSVEDVKEVIHRLKVNQNGLSLDITDVGFGISQVLPIIVQGFLSKDDSITIVEQPEIHLHPMMQAELADLFIDVICNTTSKEKKTLLIETHSESILKRLRRRIAEGKIKNTDVAIYFVHGRKKKTDAAKIERIEIGEKGNFDWPKEFYSTDFEDTNEFLKHQ